MDVWFGYWVSHGSAWEDEDYTWDIGPYSAMAVIRAGTTSTSIEIDVIGDTIYEPTRTCTSTSTPSTRSAPPYSVTLGQRSRSRPRSTETSDGGGGLAHPTTG